MNERNEHERLLKGLVCLIAVLVAGGPASLTAADLGTTQGTQWSPYLQWTLVNPTWNGNAFDMRATVEFTHRTSGEKRRTEMFFLGEKSWAFRFTGTQLGLWSFVTSSEDEDLAGHTGRVTIAPNPCVDAHGFLKKIGNKWGWEGTDNVFVPQLAMWGYIIGNDSPRTFHNKPELVDRTIEHFFGGHGFNGFHLAVIGGRWFDCDAASDRIESNMTDPDPHTFEALELLITRTHKAGGMVHIWPWGDDMRSQTPRSLKGGIGGAVEKRLQRYVAARLGPVPGWSMGYGFDLDEWVTASQVKAWRDAMHRHMGWGHFLGGRPMGPRKGVDHSGKVEWNTGLDYSSYEHHRPTYEVYRAAMQAIPDQPVMSEDRFRVRTGRYPKKDYSEELTRRGLYHSTLAGGVANIWGIHPDLGPGGVFPNKDQIKTYSVFFHDKSRFLADMTPAEKLSRDADTRVLLSRGSRSLILYRENTAAMQIDLSGMGGRLPAVAVDTLKAYAEIPLGDLQPQAQTIELPGESDWVVAVGCFGQAQLSFTDIWEGPRLKGGHGAMWADVDSDGLPDVYFPLIVSGTLPDLFMHNKGGGVFAEEGQQRGIADLDGGSHGAAWCDLDNDGDYDLINGTTFDDNSGIQNDVFRNDGTGRFVEMKPQAIESRQEATRAFLCFDMDRDGDLDLFGVTNYQGSGDPPGERNEVYRNEGDFKFTSITTGDLHAAPAGQGATDTDYDGDGDIDVLAANRTGPVNILKNDGKGHFTLTDPAAVGIRHRALDGVTTADVDNDGDLDMLLAGNNGQGYLYTSNGNGVFTHAQSFSGTSGYMGGFADLDNDGDLDLYFAGDTKVFLNDGAGVFSPGPKVSLEGKNDPRGVAFADMDDDGDLDIAVGNKRSARNFILRNNLTGGGHWLKIRLVTANGQAGAFGAKTYVYPAGRTNGAPLAMRESQSNCGYLGQNDPVLHFGLGSQTSVDVVVMFLDGTRATRHRVATNQTILIPGGAEQAKKPRKAVK